MLNNEGYSFNINNAVHVYEITENAKKNIAEHTISNCKYFPDDVKKSVTIIIALLPSNGFINIYPDRIDIGYKYDKSGFTYLLISNYSIEYEGTNDSYSEPLTGIWYANIFYTPKG